MTKQREREGERSRESGEKTELRRKQNFRTEALEGCVPVFVYACACMCVCVRLYACVCVTLSLFCLRDCVEKRG